MAPKIHWHPQYSTPSGTPVTDYELKQENTYITSNFCSLRLWVEILIGTLILIISLRSRHTQTSWQDQRRSLSMDREGPDPTNFGSEWSKSGVGRSQQFEKIILGTWAPHYLKNMNTPLLTTVSAANHNNDKPLPSKNSSFFCLSLGSEIWQV